MESDLLDMINDVIHSYSVSDDLDKMKELWHKVEPIVGSDTCRAFLLGSVYGQCIFLHNSYFTHKAVKCERKKNYEELVTKLIKGMACDFRHLNQKHITQKK